MNNNCQYPDCAVPAPHVAYKEMLEAALLQQAQYWKGAGVPWSYIIREEQKTELLWTITVAVMPTSSYHKVILAKQSDLPRDVAYQKIMVDILTIGFVTAYRDLVTIMRSDSVLVRIPDHRAYPLTPEDCK